MRSVCCVFLGIIEKFKVKVFLCINLDRRIAHISWKIRTNPPSFAKFRFFFSCSLCEPALSCHHTMSLQLKEIWSNETVNVCTKAVRWASPCTTSAEVWSTPATSSARRPTAGVQKGCALDGISIFHLSRSLSTQCVTPVRSCEARWKERRNPTWTEKPRSFLSV